MEEAETGRRLVLVNGFEAWVETPSGSYPLGSQRYHPDTVHPQADLPTVEFSSHPWPCWTYHLPDGTRLVQETLVPHRQGCVLVAWKLRESLGESWLRVRPLISGRDAHALHHENPGFRFAATVLGECVEWCPYPGIPHIASWCNGSYRAHPCWYRHFQYDDDRAGGADYCEDLASPGELIWALSRHEAFWLLAVEESGLTSHLEFAGVQTGFDQLRAEERARRNRRLNRQRRTTVRPTAGSHRATRS
jgi:hypothetical protein